MPVDSLGGVNVAKPEASTLQLANGETGICQRLPDGIHVTDATQAAGKIPMTAELKKSSMAIISAHKLGGPRGFGALLLGEGQEIDPRQPGGGQEFGRRSGTEDVAGAAGFGEAALASAKEVENGEWQRLQDMRDRLESKLMNSVSGLFVVGLDSVRLPNTSCFAMPGWKSSLQVIRMDLDGYAISAGSACSSGKVNKRESLAALGLGDEISESAVRVSFGPSTREEDLFGFADVWIMRCREHQAIQRLRAAASAKAA